MNPRKNLWIIVSPVFSPAPGGGAIYNDTIGRALAAAGDNVLVIAERHPGEPIRSLFSEAGGKAEVFRYLPYRAGRSAKDWRSYVAYALANLWYLRLPNIIRREAARDDYASVTILLHSSLLYNPSLLEGVLQGLRPKSGIHSLLVADVRDYRFPSSKLHLLGNFDAIITSSEGVALDLARRAPSISNRLAPIPMPFSPPDRPSEATVEQVLSRHRLVPERYVFNPNGIADAKHYPAMRDAIPLLRQHPGFENAILVTAGRERDRRDTDRRAEERGLTRYLGTLPHNEILALMKGALITPILSDREAISRAALEAMWVEGRVLLPDLPEFRQDCGSHVCSQITPENIANLIVRLAGKPMPPFSFTNHAAETFVPMYRRLVLDGTTSHSDEPKDGMD